MIYFVSIADVTKCSCELNMLFLRSLIKQLKTQYYILINFKV